MANFRLELGFDWDASLIGSAVGESIEYRPLQMGLVNVDTSAAAFYSFNTGDTIYFQVYNIGATTSGIVPRSLKLVLKNSISGNLNMDVLPGIPAPDESGVWQVSPRPQGVQSLAFNSATYPAWAVRSATARQFTFQAQPEAIELSAKIVVRKDGAERVFVGDPEMWIGDD